MKKYLSLILIVVIGFIPLLGLFNSGLPKTHDGQDHIARIANFYLNLTEGNSIPRWAPNLNWGYGHPILMFLYPMPSYMASFIHLLGFSLVDSVKIVFGLSFILSGLTMFLFAKELFNRNAAYVAALLYMFAPYRFVDLYVRGAIGEHVAFIFPPLVFYFLYRIFKKESMWNVIGGSFSLAGLFLSHNAISLMFLPLFILFIAYMLWQEKKKFWRLTQVFGVFLCGFMLAGFFLIPAFMEGKYTLRDIVTENEYMSRFETFSRFVYSPWSFKGTNEFSVQVGLIQWVFVLAIPFVLYFIRREKKRLFFFGLGLFMLFWLTLLIMMRVSLPLYEIITTLQKFQFPWRFLTLTVFITSLLSGFVIFLSPKKIQGVAVLLLSCGVLLVNSNYWHAKEYLKLPESFYTSIYNGTTDTGESAPIWSVRFMLERPKAHSEIIEGKATIKELSRTSTSREYEIISEEKSRIRENTLYFPGWNVYVSGSKAEIEFQDQLNRGLITYFVPEGKHLVRIEFVNTKLRQIAEIVSVAGLTGIGLYVLLYKRIRLWKRFQ